MEGDKILVTVPKEEIRGVQLRHDSKSRHPFLRFLSGFVLVVTGLVLVIAAFIMAEGGVYLVKIRSLTLGIPIAPLVIWLMVGVGLWLLIGVFRGRYNLLINAQKGIRKIFFGESADIREIIRFIRRANQELGYQIDLSLTETMYIADLPSEHQRSTGT
ncbi:MAG TPA: hypothetical protein VL197_09500 [Nitrospirota bacterium]|nr:hypothetical protein [Nitrospirota bacterium]